MIRFKHPAGIKKWITWIRQFVWEVVLIFVGIFLAIQANNWNEERLEQKRLRDVLERVALGIDDDIREMERNQKRFELKEPLFAAFRRASPMPEQLKQGLTTILIEPVFTVFSQSEIEQLRGFSTMDTLSLEIIKIYDQMQNTEVTPFEKRITEEVTAVNDHFRDNYQWYPEWSSRTPDEKTSSEELKNYFLNSSEYRNYVISRHELIYENYLPTLKNYIKKLKKVRKSLKSRQTEEFTHINSFKFWSSMF